MSASDGGCAALVHPTLATACFGRPDKPHSGASGVTVTRVLRTVVGLQSAWHAARLARAQSEARAEWLKALEQYPGLGTKLLRAMAPSAYA